MASRVVLHQVQKGSRDRHACYRTPSHDVMGYLSVHWPKPPSRQDQFGYHVFGYGAAISPPIEHDSRGLSVQYNHSNFSVYVDGGIDYVK
ncbi:hypothetical protein E2C01_099878 [Portunus trituberculatus]|uniref:Uncharacterized protein n=1 Tax=Portunus trituberculatus TaxID=210409 RepID=A0A5B7KBV6_PORTR|nr:hypothetical protein [Portunus trituberculatus]